MTSRPRPSPCEFTLFAEAVSALSLAAFAVRFWPFRWIVRSLGRSDVHAGKADPAAIATAVRRASRRLPWRTVCFQEGLAAHWMLRRRGVPSRLHYGLRSDAERLSAHVWVTVEGRYVIGEEDRNPHAPIASFPASLVDG